MLHTAEFFNRNCTYGGRPLTTFSLLKDEYQREFKNDVVRHKALYQMCFCLSKSLNEDGKVDFSAIAVQEEHFAEMTQKKLLRCLLTLSKIAFREAPPQHLANHLKVLFWH